MLTLASVTFKMTSNIAILMCKLLQVKGLHYLGIFYIKILMPVISAPCRVGVTVGHFQDIKLKNHQRMRVTIHLARD